MNITPYDQVKAARETLIFALRLCDMVKQKEITIEDLSKTVTTDGIKLIGGWSPNDITGLQRNLTLCALGNCFVAVDEALNIVFGEKPIKFSDGDIDALRAIIYMLRCAIAHGPTQPKWQAKGEYCRKFTISEIDYEFDASYLDCRAIKHKDYGGLPGAIRLINYTLIVIERNQSVS